MRPDMRVVLFAIGATVATAIVLGGIGALHAMRASIAPALSEVSAAGVGGRSPSRLRTALAALQIAVSLLLLVGAALLVRSVRGAATIDLGFDPRGVVAVDVDGAGGRTAADRDIAFRRVIHRLSTLPGVEAAAVATRAPLDSSTPIARVNVRPVSTAEDASPIASFMMIGPRYFDVVKTPIVAGRPFTEDDSAARPAVAIVNETLARRLWPEGSAIGQRLWLEAHASADPCVVVGVASNSRYLTLGEEGQAHVYLPSAQHPRTGTTLLVRSAVEPNRMMREMQEALSAVDPQAIGFFPRTLTEHVAASLVPIRLARSLAVGLAGLALALAALGLYGLVSFVVAERTREIGLRVALGATDRQVMRLVVGFGLKLAGAGLAIGIPAALAGSRLLGTLLYGVSATDPAVFAAAPAMVVAVALAACCVPAVRAVRLDPIQAIRNQ
jgi:predicted permease